MHPDPQGIMTGSPVLVGDTLYTGVSASGASGPGATFRGAMVALNAQTPHPLAELLASDNGGLQEVTPGPRCSRRPRSTFRQDSSTVRSVSRTRNRRVSSRATRPTVASPNRASSPAPT